MMSSLMRRTFRQVVRRWLRRRERSEWSVPLCRRGQAVAQVLELVSGRELAPVQVLVPELALALSPL